MAQSTSSEEGEKIPILGVLPDTSNNNTYLLGVRDDIRRFIRGLRPTPILVSINEIQLELERLIPALTKLISALPAEITTEPQSQQTWEITEMEISVGITQDGKVGIIGAAEFGASIASSFTLTVRRK